MGKREYNIDAKESLMSTYFDTDKIKYCDEIIQLGNEIYNSDADMYYKGQAIRQIANTYAENGNYEMAEKWVKKSVKIFHSRDVLYTEIDRGQAAIEELCIQMMICHMRCGQSCAICT